MTWNGDTFVVTDTELRNAQVREHAEQRLRAWAERHRAAGLAITRVWTGRAYMFEAASR